MEHKLTKEEYAQKMKEKRLFLFDMANQQLIKTTSSNELYLNYLALQGKLLYTVTNTLLVQTQKPDAILLKDVAHWQEDGYFIKNGEKGIQIL